MRKESRDVAAAFRDGVPCTRARTSTDGTRVLLYGYKIAWRNADGSITVTLAGWGTDLTRERLNAITQLLFGWAGFHREDGVEYFRGKPCDLHAEFTIHDIAK